MLQTSPKKIRTSYLEKCDGTAVEAVSSYWETLAGFINPDVSQRSANMAAPTDSQMRICHWFQIVILITISKRRLFT